MIKTTKKTANPLATPQGIPDGTVAEKSNGRSSATTPRLQYRVMDEVARKRRLKHELDSLERDNYHEDPHANLTLSKKVPKFEDGSSEKHGSEKRRNTVRLRSLNFAQLLDEDMKRPPPNYSSAIAPSPELYNLARRHFCGVCGYNGKYTCVTCGARFCSITCQGTHKETRCMKWIS